MGRFREVVNVDTRKKKEAWSSGTPECPQKKVFHGGTEYKANQKKKKKRRKVGCNGYHEGSELNRNTRRGGDVRCSPEKWVSKGYEGTCGVQEGDSGG